MGTRRRSSKLPKAARWCLIALVFAVMTANAEAESPSSNSKKGPESILDKQDDYGPDFQNEDMEQKFGAAYAKYKVALQEMENAMNELRSVANTWPRTVDYVLLPTNPSSQNLDLTINQIRRRQQWALRQINSIGAASATIHAEAIPGAIRAVEFLTEWHRYWMAAGKTSSDEPGVSDWYYWQHHVAPQLVHVPWEPAKFREKVDEYRRDAGIPEYSPYPSGELQQEGAPREGTNSYDPLPGREG